MPDLSLIDTDIPLKTREYYTVHQMRIDRWSTLKRLTAAIVKSRSKEKRKSLSKEAQDCLKEVKTLEYYWAFPSYDNVIFLERLLKKQDFSNLHYNISRILKLLISESYRYTPLFLDLNNELDHKKQEREDRKVSEDRHYFEVLFVDDIDGDEEQKLRDKLSELRQDSDEYIYDIVVVKSFQDALISVLFNYNIQVCVVRYDTVFKSKQNLDLLKPFITTVLRIDEDEFSKEAVASALSRYIKAIRPELDLYFVTNNQIIDLEDHTISSFRRIFYRKEDYQELHLSIQRGIKERFQTPFFTALFEYSQKPTSVFHAMPISRGNSIFKSFWIKDLAEFYGRNLFLAETSATTGGLDSLLQPTGPMKKAQEQAADAFGSDRTYFVTNGTSTANKIVLQALCSPGDRILIDRDCHKSHHYGLMLSGAIPVYLESYPIQEYSMYGAVPISTIKRNMLKLKKAGELDKVKMLIMTNCTFDGLVYNVERVMEEVLAIKPDMVFLWDEAWFAFAYFTPTYRKRTAMYVASKLEKKYRSQDYRASYEKHIAELSEGEIPLLPDPDKVKVRVYSTQSTHKTLSSLRQGSMIHVHDELFKRYTKEAFHEAYMTHTSTSPNYQILASLDVGRRQVEFEGFEMVEKSIELAMVLRARIKENVLLSKYFDVLSAEDFIPKRYRKSGLKEYYDKEKGWNRLDEAWESDEFVLDPTKINLFIGRTGVDGDTFKNKYLMDQFNIQINKTSRNTVLFMTNIGTTRGSVAYLYSALFKIAQQLESEQHSLSEIELESRSKRVTSLIENTPPLPDFSGFHEAFRIKSKVPGGHLRRAYFLAYEEENCCYLKLIDALKQVQSGEQLVSAGFVIPYPPGFPILVPGQIVSEEILTFFLALDVKEIHGYREELGLQLFTKDVLELQSAANKKRL